jgi:hypothetical protein
MLENTVQVLTKDNSRLILEVAETRDAEVDAESVAPPGGGARTRRKKRRLSATSTKAVFLETLSPLQCDLVGRLEVNLPVLARLNACGLRLSVAGSASSVSGAKCVNVEHAWFPAPRRASSEAGGRAPLPLQATVPGGASDAGRSRAPMPPLGVSKLPLLNGALVPAQGQLSNWMRSSHALTVENSAQTAATQGARADDLQAGFECRNALRCPLASLKKLATQ